MNNLEKIILQIRNGQIDLALQTSVSELEDKRKNGMPLSEDEWAVFILSGDYKRLRRSRQMFKESEYLLEIRRISETLLFLINSIEKN